MKSGTGFREWIDDSDSPPGESVLKVFAEKNAALVFGGHGHDE